MQMNEIRLPDLQALIAFGKVGVNLLASRILSMTALFGTIALGAYAVYASSWQGAAITGILALFVFIPALKAESRGRSGVKDGTQEA